ncbi:MerR family transcriptional regulator [Pseudonocardia spinosispora]|uniref:MerR family transcriptional regulator n=1 Tax=Pseudonocardia spinosispora TaxID=103441 RepID=UPI0004082A72|nr:MerR family transcriptional regulator [Pseudonocardia spinosispora]
MTQLTEITEVAEHFGLALSTLRYWERQGLLTSHRRATRRCYDTDQLYRIALIKHWRDTGLMSINDIRAILSETPGSDTWLATTSALLTTIEERTAQLETAHRYLQHLSGCRHPGAPEMCPGFQETVDLPPGL